MEEDRYYLEIALAEAELAFNEGSIPIGAVIVGPSGEILSTGRNRVFSSWDPCAHAEVDAIRNAGKKLFEMQYKNKCTIYSTVEPCPMCSGALIFADISRAVWALTDQYLGAMRILKEGQHFRHKFDKVEITSQPYIDLAERSEELHKAYDFRRGREYFMNNIKES